MKRIKKIMMIISLLVLLFIPNTKVKANENEMTTWYCGNLGYWIYKPESYSTTDQALPLIIYLHGIGERGNDLSKLLNVSLPMYLYNDTIDVNAIVIMPQCPSNKTWVNMTDELVELILTIEEDNNIDTNRVSITGHSLGGIGTWEIARRFPQMFSCIVPVSSVIQNDENISALSELPVWAFHGANDSMSYMSIINALPQLNNTYLTILPNRGHTITDIYIDEEYNILEWMINHSREEYIKDDDDL